MPSTVPSTSRSGGNPGSTSTKETHLPASDLGNDSKGDCRSDLPGIFHSRRVVPRSQPPFRASEVRIDERPAAVPAPGREGPAPTSAADRARLGRMSAKVPDRRQGPTFVRRAPKRELRWPPRFGAVVAAGDGPHRFQRHSGSETGAHRIGEQIWASVEANCTRAVAPRSSLLDACYGFTLSSIASAPSSKSCVTASNVVFPSKAFGHWKGSSAHASAASGVTSVNAMVA